MLQQIKQKVKKELYGYLGFKKDTSDVGKHNEVTRVKWLEDTLRKIPAGHRILDAGAGELQFKKFCSHLTYVSQDFAQYDGKGDDKGLQTNSWDNSKIDIVSDITSIPVENNSFDAAMCIEVLEHVPDPVAAIHELTRVLKPGGYLVITAPFCSLTHFSPFHFSTGFNRYFYEKNLGDRGYKILDMQENGNYFEFLAQEVRRISDMTSKYTSQQLNEPERASIDQILLCLDRLSRSDGKSKELLCFGYHVFAQKL